MKRCLVGWMQGSYNFRSKFEAAKIQKISEWMRNTNEYNPSEFTRQSRALNDIGHWKAIEFRNFLLYFGPVTLKDVLQKEMYDHFLLLSAAIRILSCDAFSKNERMREIAHSMLLDYIELYIDLYGIDSINSNVHNLAHLVKDVEKFGSLHKFSAYPFESTLYRIKKSLKCGFKPLAQAGKREIESQSACRKIVVDTQYPILLNKNETNENSYLKIKFESFTLSANVKDKWFLTSDSELVAMDYAVQIDDKIFVIGKKIKKIVDFFKKPFESSLMNIYEASLEFESPNHYSIDKIICKMVGLKSYGSSFVFYPLIHTFIENSEQF